MINKFYSGMSKKITALALIICLVFGIATLTNAPSYAEKNTNKYSTPSKFQLFDPSYQYFNNLDQLCRYADFSFQLPNYLPKIFQIDDYRIHRSNNQSYITANYWYNTMGGAMVEGAKEEHFTLTISKTNLLKKLSPQLTEEQKQQSNFIASYKSEPKVLAGISGIQLTVFSKDKKGYPSGANDTYKEDKTQYFIWESNDVWYAIECLSEIIKKNESYYLLKLSDKEIGLVINSLTNPEKITHKGYFIEEERPCFAVYDEIDLKRIEEDWGFSPRLPMVLPGLKAKKADMYDAYFDDEQLGIFNVSYISNKSTSRRSIAKYEQATQPVEYNTVEKLYKEQQNGTSKTNESEYILQTINGKNVYAQEEKVYKRHRIRYCWDKGSFTMEGELGDHIEILKQLVN